jgi:hypothetical protein
VASAAGKSGFYTTVDDCVVRFELTGNENTGYDNNNNKTNFCSESHNETVFPTQVRDHRDRARAHPGRVQRGAE